MQLVQWLYPDAPARFYIDGRRVNRAAYESAYDMSRTCCYTTRAWQMPGGTFKRRNSCVVSPNQQRRGRKA
jgi:hypothetical protein